MTTPSPRVQLLSWLSVAVAVRIVANALTLRLGFQAVSDDDFARVAIAQSFAHAPRWDASGTSWLPAPFWLTGGAMWLSVASFEVARAVAWFTSLGSVVAFAACCHAVGVRGRWLGLAACCFAALPHAVWLGLATVPEGFVAVLTLASLTTVHGSPRAAWCGAVCLLFATLSRYETWPAALVVAAYHGFELRRAPARWRLPVLLLCLTGPALWVCNGILSHGEAFFFVKRVTSYRAALETSPKDWLGVLDNYPRALLVEEPVLTTLTAALGVFAFMRRRSAIVAPFTGWPLVWGALATLGFLIWGDLTNGAPTHHPERTLLPCWLVLVVLGAEELTRLFDTAQTALTRRQLAAFALVPLALGSGLLWQLPYKQFVDRSAELTLGGALAPSLGPDKRLWVETDGYGYLAIGVGTRQPWLVDGFNAGDPRQREQTPPYEDSETLAMHLRERRASLAVVPSSRRTAFAGWAKPEGNFGSSLIFRIQPSSPAENSERPAD